MEGIRIAVVPAPSTPAASGTSLRVRLVPDAVTHSVDRRFLSVSVDLGRLLETAPLGSAPTRLDLDRPRLLNLARALSPAYLRIGGPLADRTYYDLQTRAKPAPGGYAAVLTAADWDAAINFAQDAGLAVIFTLNAGPGVRGRSGAWRTDQARTLVDHASARRDPVLVWAFGHESTAQRPRFGGDEVAHGQYADDLTVAAELIRIRSQGSLLSASLPGFEETDDALTRAASAVDIITWPFGSDPAPGSASTPMPDDLSSSAETAERMRAAAGAEDKPLWLGDTAAATGGATAPSLDWVERLARLAQRGHSVVVRRGLTSAPSGLIDDEDLQPRADYWASVVWKRLMGREVLIPEVEPTSDVPVSAYAHWTPAGGGIPEDCVTLLLLNRANAPAQAELPGLACHQALAFRFSAPTGAAPIVVNGHPVHIDPDGRLSTLVGHLETLDPQRACVGLDGRSFGFFVLAPTGATFSDDPAARRS